jgi:hypothetical protein
MEYAGNISGNKPHVRKYGVDGGVTINAGEPAVTGESVADNGGVTVATTIAAVGFMGCALADATSTDAQSGTTTNNVQQVSVVINPDAMWRARFSGAATEDTALTLLTSTAAVTAGTTVSGATDEFTIWCYEGANVGERIFRRATAANTVVVAFPQDIASGDTWLQVPLSIGSRSQYPQLTTNLTQVDASAAVDSDNANFISVDFLFRDVTDDGRSNSYALLISVDHAFGPNPV